MQDPNFSALEARAAIELTTTREEFLRASRLPEATLREQIRKSAALRRINQRLAALEHVISIYEAAGKAGGGPTTSRRAPSQQKCVAPPK